MLVLVWTAAAACSSGGSSGPARAPAHPGEVRIAVGEDIWPLTGTGPSSKAFAAGDLSVNVYEPLVTLGSDYTVKPGLAERWELVDPLTWRFHLRHGVTFHDGRPFTADDVVWSWTGRQFLPTAVTATLTTVTKVDDFTVDFVSSTPNLRLPDQLVHPEGPIVPKGSNNDAVPPVGTGPYRVVDYQPHHQVTVERYDGYWGEKAKEPRLTFEFMPDPMARVDALRSGAVDMVAGLPAEDAASVEADPRFHLVEAKPGATQSLSMSTAGVLADATLREAIGLAVDRAAYVSNVLHGHGQPGRWMAPAQVLGTSASLVDPPRFDPDAARRLLDGAGWTVGPDGTRTNGGRRLDLILIGGPLAPEDGLKLIQTQLRSVGMQASVKKAADTVTYQQYRDKGYDLDLTVAHQNDANPAFLVGGRTSSDAEYQQAASEARSAPTEEAAQRAAATMMQIVVNRDHLTVPVAGITQIFALRSGIDVTDPHPSDINQIWTGVTAA